MTSLMLLLVIAASSAMMVSFIVESSTWWIRGACSPGMIGLYVSRSNIYQYCGRFFALSFNALIALSIENRASASYVTITLAAGFALTCIVHAALLLGGAPTRLTILILGKILFLPNQIIVEEKTKPERRWAITLPTGFATLCYCLGMALPLLLAVFVPQYRMSLSYTGQIVNAVGTFMLLFMVDQPMFRSLDNARLHRDLPSYTLGRICAFGIAAVICLIFYGLIRNG